MIERHRLKGKRGESSSLAEKVKVQGRAFSALSSCGAGDILRRHVADRNLYSPGNSETAEEVVGRIVVGSVGDEGGVSSSSEHDRPDSSDESDVRDGDRDRGPVKRPGNPEVD